MNLPTHGERGFIVRLPAVAASGEQIRSRGRHSHEMGRTHPAIPLNNGIAGGARLPERAEHLLEQRIGLAERILADRRFLARHHQEQAVERLAGYIGIE